LTALNGPTGRHEHDASTITKNPQDFFVTDPLSTMAAREDTWAAP
jgi:hypothetical protein